MTTPRTCIWTTVAALLVIGALALMGGCGGGSTPAGPKPIVDVAISSGEITSSWEYNHDAVFVWLDILNNPAQGRAPDVLLDLSDERNPYEVPRYVRIYGDQLFVLSTHRNSSNGAILIWNDFRNIEGNPEPDIVLSGGSGMYHPNYMQVFEDDLYVSNERANEVLIFRDVLTLESEAEPDVVLGDNAPMLQAAVGKQPDTREVVEVWDGLYEPNGLVVTEHALYVTSHGYNQVVIWNDPALLETGAMPSVILGDPGSEASTRALLGGSLLAGVKHCFLEDNVLYVTCTRRDTGSANGVWAFSPADNLTNFQVPDYILGGPIFENYPMCVRTGGGRLWVGLADYQTGLMGWDLTPATGDLPQVELMTEVYGGYSEFTPPWTPEQGAYTFVTRRVHDFVTVAGGLIGISWQYGAAFGYLDASAITTDTPPDYLIWWPGLDEVRSVDAVVR